MRHANASTLLTDLAAGALEPGVRRGVAQHVAGCARCRDWLASYRFLREALAESVESPPRAHPTSHQLAAFYMAPETLDELTRKRCERHLEGCDRCLSEGVLAAEAVAAARGSRIGVLVRSPASRPWLAAAASFLLLVGVLAYGRVSRAPLEYSLLGEQLEGSQTFEARRSIIIGATEVHSGASVTLSSGEFVTFENGFSVAADAQLSVVVDSEDDPGRWSL